MRLAGQYPLIPPDAILFLYEDLNSFIYNNIVNEFIHTLNNYEY